MSSPVQNFFSLLTQAISDRGWLCEPDEDYLKVRLTESGVTVNLWLRVQPALDHALFALEVDSFSPLGVIQDEAAIDHIRHTVLKAHLRYQQVSFRGGETISLRHSCHHAAFRSPEELQTEVNIFLQTLSSYARFVSKTWEKAREVLLRVNLERMKNFLREGLEEKGYTWEVNGGLVVVRAARPHDSFHQLISICGLTSVNTGELDFTFQVDCPFPGSGLTPAGAVLVSDQVRANSVVSFRENRLCLRHRFHAFTFRDQDLLATEVSLFVKSLVDLFELTQSVWEKAFIYDYEALALRGELKAQLEEWECLHDDPREEELFAWISSELLQVKSTPIYLGDVRFFRLFVLWVSLDYSTPLAA